MPQSSTWGHLKIKLSNYNVHRYIADVISPLKEKSGVSLLIGSLLRKTLLWFWALNILICILWFHYSFVITRFLYWYPATLSDHPEVDFTKRKAPTILRLQGCPLINIQSNINDNIHVWPNDSSWTIKVKRGKSVWQLIAAPLQTKTNGIIFKTTYYTSLST